MKGDAWALCPHPPYPSIWKDSTPSQQTFSLGEDIPLPWLDLGNSSQQLCPVYATADYSSDKLHLAGRDHLLICLNVSFQCREQEPSFRAFLKRHNRTPETRMSTLQELFLLLSCRIQDYIRLLIHQEHCTPVDHADRADLSSAIRTFQDLQERIDQVRIVMSFHCFWFQVSPTLIRPQAFLYHGP